MECGLDPGIDHMSAMKLIDKLKEDGAKITSFRSYCGGLVAPESNTNPWGYKVTWNPRNVVLAGMGTSLYLENDQLKIVPYSQLFQHTTNLQFEDYGEYEAYPNRDSISYIEKYGLQEASSFLRGTIRYKGFCAAWDKLVKLGFTDDSVRFRSADKMKISEMTNSFCQNGTSVSEYLKLEKDEFQKLDWLGVFSDSYLQVKSDATPAECLQKIIEDKWKLSEVDKDLVLMQHQIDFELNGNISKIISSLSVEGNDLLDTAMARTVGLPLGIATLLLFQNKIVSKGVLTPVLKEIYNPILEELQTRKILFRENTYSS
jgi:saccharopine dehydrogenase (NADP+, L-glutamate forming)